MTKVTVIDCQTAGISGDMLLGALIDAGANTKVIQTVFDLVPKYFPKCKSIRLETREVKKHDFRARKADLKIVEEDHVTAAKSLAEAALSIAVASRITENAASFAVNSIKTLADAESELHGTAPAETHLHEAGSTDTLADILGVAAACDNLQIFDGQVYSTAVAVGGGKVSFSHGTTPIPPPAVLEILRQHGFPMAGASEQAELTTPTGISMLVNLAKVAVTNYPPMVVDAVGYGAGEMDLNSTPNLLRIVIGRSADPFAVEDSVKILETNLDDLPGEVLGHALQLILESGAKDAWFTPAQFKKNRPGYVLHVICSNEDASKISRIMMEETGTLGVRHDTWNRFTLERSTTTLRVEIGTKAFDVRIKVAKDLSGKVLGLKPEFDDIQAIAQSVSMPARQVAEIVLHEARKRLEEK